MLSFPRSINYRWSQFQVFTLVNIQPLEIGTYKFPLWVSDPLFELSKSTFTIQTLFSGEPTGLGDNLQCPSRTGPLGHLLISRRLLLDQNSHFQITF